MFSHESSHSASHTHEADHSHTHSHVHRHKHNHVHEQEAEHDHLHQEVRDTGHLTSCNAWPRATPTATTPTRPGGGATSGWRWTRPSGCWGPTWPRSTAGWRGWAGDGGQVVKTTSSLVISSFVFQHSTLFSSVIYLFLFLGWLGINQDIFKKFWGKNSPGGPWGGGYKHYIEVPTVDSVISTNCHWRMFERAGKDHYFTYFIHLKTSICSR